MEGILLKWTNYWNGWQPRWFVLKDGVLSYYNNQAESKTGGCKRSFKINMFDIIVSKNDNTRVDLIIANDQHLYLRAGDFKERQKWLVALASQKALCSSSNIINSPQSLTVPLLLPNLQSSDECHSNEAKTTHKSNDAGSGNHSGINPIQHLTPFDTTNLLKIKQSELRLYCDLLTQQTHDLKNLIVQLKNENVQERQKDLIINNDNGLISIRHADNLLADNALNINIQSNKIKSDQVSLSSSFKSMDNYSVDGTIEPENDMNCNSLSNNENVNGNKENNEAKTDVKKMDDITSNINITCDMLITILRNLIVLSNASSNISPSALSSLLQEASASSSSSNSAYHVPYASFDNISQYQYHLYHPLYSNNQLSRYRTTSIAAEPASTKQTNPPATHQNNSINEKSIIDENNNTKNACLTAKLVSNDSETSSITASSATSSSTSTNQSATASAKLESKIARTTARHHANAHLALNDTSYKNLFTKNVKYNQHHQQLNFQRFNKLPVLHEYNNNFFNSLNYEDSSSSSSFFTMPTTKLIRKNQIDFLKETSLGVNIESREDKKEVPSEQMNEHKIKQKDNHKYSTVIVSNSSCESLTIIAEKNYEKTRIYVTFFTNVKFRFYNIELLENNEIPTEIFLSCCKDMFSLLDNFGSKAFIPVKIDVNGNINKLRQKFSSDTQKYHTLQNIVQTELDENVTHVKNSATDALLWLARGISFLREFLKEFSSQEEPNMSECVLLSYQNSLKKYHNWVVRSIFSIAMSALPHKDDFLYELAVEKIDFLNNKKLFEYQVKEDMKLTYNGVDKILRIIDDFYNKNNLEI